MAGTLLYGQSKAKWQTIQKKGLAIVRQDGNDITHVLKLSYYHLDAHLKSCFSFCAVFPKDYFMNKFKLINLWLAQGYVEPLDEGQSIYEASEEYFSILLRRCFFQNVTRNEYGEVRSCKMHDFMPDIAQEVAGDEICKAHSSMSKINEKTRHVFHVKHDCGQSSLRVAKIRTCLIERMPKSISLDGVVREWKYLRALDLQSSPSCAIGRLLHLRYLDLSENYWFERLPQEITKLYNLQTLLLRGCFKLKELPSDLSKLAKLRVLDIEGCAALTYMPCGLDKLIDLCILNLFVVGVLTSSNQKQGVGRLEDIAALDDLKDRLNIEIHDNSKTYVKGNEKGGFLKRKEHISEIVMRWLPSEIDENKVVRDKALAEELEPNLNLKTLRIFGYRDMEKPSWATGEKLQTSLPNLVCLEFCSCKGLEDLPMLGRFRFLKMLRVQDLVKLEYMETGSSSSYSGDETSNGSTGLFPSLENLWLRRCPKLKGWWRGDGHMDDDDNDDRSHMSILFPRLRSLNIIKCPLLTSVPLCPTAEELNLKDFNGRISIMKRRKGVELEDGDGQVMDMSSSVVTVQPKLTEVNTDDIGYLMKSLPMPAAFQSLSKMTIWGDKKVENLREVKDVFRSCSSSLKVLTIVDCSKLRSISGVFEHLTALRYLYLHIPDNTVRVRLEEDDEIQWSALQHSLDYLMMNYMPRGIRDLTSLETLIIRDGRHVETIPEWFTCLSSLRHLEIWKSSPELT